MYFPKLSMAVDIPTNLTIRKMKVFNKTNMSPDDTIFSHNFDTTVIL